VPDPAGRIDEVLLVGGASRMPAVAAALQERYGWKPRLHDPDLAVAKGAARFALTSAVWDWNGTGGQERAERVDAIAEAAGMDPKVLTELARKQIVTVLPKAFGIRLVDTDRPDWRADLAGASYVKHLVHADETLPSRAGFVSGTVQEDQREVEIEIYEQAGGAESTELADNKAVDHGKGLISGLPPHLPFQSPIEITMSVDREGLLRVEAKEPRSGRDLVIEVRVSVLSEEEIRRATDAVRGIAVRS